MSELSIAYQFMITKDASSYCLVMVTVTSEKEGKKIAQAFTNVSSLGAIHPIISNESP